MRLLTDNKYFDDTLTLTVSSEDSEFPKENYNEHARTKVHRSTGNYVIVVNSNDDIDFDEGGGALVATVAAATYTPTTLAAAIKAALDAAGGDTYTVSFAASTGKWTITTDGGTLNMQWATGTNVATSIGADIGFTADDTGATTYVGDSVALHTEEWVVIDLGSALAIDSFCAFYQANPKVVSPFTSATLKLQANATDAWTSPTVDVTLTPDTAWPMISHFFSSDQSYRYWRFHVVDPTNTNLYIDFPKLFLSKASSMVQAPEIGWQASLTDPSRRKSTAYGNEFYDQYPLRQGFGVTWNHLTEADSNTFKQLFRDVGKRQPIAFVFDHDETGFSNKEEFIFYTRFTKPPVVTHTFSTFFSAGANFMEAV